MSGSTPATTPWPAQRLAASLFLVLGTDMFIISPLLPQISAEFGVGTSAASALAWSFALVYAVLSPAMALITNRFTRRSAMCLGAAVFSVGLLGTGLLPSLGLVIVARVVAAIGASIMGPPVWSFASETAAPHEVGRAVAAVAATFAAGQVIGVPLGSLVASAVSWRWLFIGLGVALAVIAALIFTRLGTEARVPERVRLSVSLSRSVGLWRRSDFSTLLTANFFAQATRYATYTFAGALLFGRFGLSTAELGLVGMGVGVGALVGSTAGGRLVDWTRARGGSQPLLNVVTAVILTGSIVLATAPVPLWLSLTGWVTAFASGSAFVSNGQEMLARSAGTGRVYAVSWNNAGLYAGTATGTVLLSSVGVGSVAFVVIAGSLGVLSVAASIVLWRLDKRSS